MIRGYGPRKRTGADRQRAAQTLLLNARDLDRITPEMLVRCYGLKPDEAARELEAARARRG